MPQGIGADLIATIEGYSRTDVDTFAAESQARAAKAIANGYFAKSVIPVKDANGLTILDHDEFVREGTTVESLAVCSSRRSSSSATWAASTPSRWSSTTRSRRSTTSTTPATRSGIVDGAALVLHRQREGRQDATA